MSTPAGPEERGEGLPLEAVYGPCSCGETVRASEVNSAMHRVGVPGHYMSMAVAAVHVPIRERRKRDRRATSAPDTGAEPDAEKLCPPGCEPVIWLGSGEPISGSVAAYMALHPFGPICGVSSASGPNGEPLACAYPPSPPGQPMHAHSWATLPTFTSDTGAEERLRAALEQIRRAYERGATRDDLVMLVDAALTGR